MDPDQDSRKKIRISQGYQYDKNIDVKIFFEIDNHELSNLMLMKALFLCNFFFDKKMLG